MSDCFQSGRTTLLPPAVHEGSSFSMPSPTLGIVFLIIAFLVGVLWNLIVVLICVSQMT